MEKAVGKELDEAEAYAVASSLPEAEDVDRFFVFPRERMDGSSPLPLSLARYGCAPGEGTATAAGGTPAVPVTATANGNGTRRLTCVRSLMRGRWTLREEMGSAMSAYF